MRKAGLNLSRYQKKVLTPRMLELLAFDQLESTFDTSAFKRGIIRNYGIKRGSNVRDLLVTKSTVRASCLCVLPETPAGSGACQ